MYNEPDEIMNIKSEEQITKLYVFNSKKKIQQIKSNLIGSVSKIIDCYVRLSDLYNISPDTVAKDKFGFGAAAKFGKNSISNIGETFGMDNRFFLANPSKVGPNDPFISIKDNIQSPFFFYTDMDFGDKIPKFKFINKIPVLEGEVKSGTIYKFNNEKPIQLEIILQKLIPNHLSAIYFKGKAYAHDVADKLLKLSPSIANRKAYGKINSPEGLNDFFVINTIPKGFSGILDIVAFGVAIKFPEDDQDIEEISISNETLKKLFYIMPNTNQNVKSRCHMHGLVFGYDETASIIDQEKLNLCDLPLSQIDSNIKEKIPSSGKVVHIENTTKLISGAFKIAPITSLEAI